MYKLRCKAGEGFPALFLQSPRRNCGSAGAKEVLGTLEKDTKANFQEKIPGKIGFQKK